MEIVKTVKVALSGYYGFNNSGDEAVLQSILAALAEEGEAQGVKVEPIVLSANPTATQSMYGVESAHRMHWREMLAAIRRSDALISGGGSLLQDATGLLTIPYYLGILAAAQRMGKPTFIYAQGIGPVHRRIWHPFIRTVFHKCAYVSVRDEESADLLRTIGVRNPIDVVPDPVMGMAKGASFETRNEHPVVGVSVRFWNDDRSELDKIALALSEINQKRKVEIRLLPFHLPTDREASEYVVEKAGHGEIIPDTPNPADMAAQVAECDVLIGMRLHSLIYSASQFVPVIGVSYDPKIDQFLRRIDVEPAGSTEALDPRRISEEAIRILDNKDEWLAARRPLIEHLRQDSRIPAQQMTALLRNRR